MLRWLRGWVLLLRARGFSPLPPAGRRQAREIISKKLSGKCGRQNASGRARDKATLQFFQTARLRGQISTVVLQRNAHQQWRLAQQTMFYGYLRVSIPKARMIARRYCLFEARVPCVGERGAPIAIGALDLSQERNRRRPQARPMSRQAKIASSFLVAFLAIELLAVIALHTFDLEPLMVLLEDAGLILVVLALPALLAVLLVPLLAMSKD